MAGPTPSTGTTSYLWLLPSVQFGERENDLYLRLNEAITTVSGFGAIGSETLRKFDGNYCSRLLIEDGDARVCAAILDRLGYLVRLHRPLSERQQENAACLRELAALAHRVREYPDRAIDIAKHKTIAIWGLGGVGTIVAHGLAALGVGRIVLLDNDFVDRTNLNRQFHYDLETSGQSKAFVLHEALGRRFSNSIIDARWIDFTPRDEIPECDLLVMSCGDPLAFRYPELIGHRPVVAGGYHGSTVTVGPLLGVRQAPCWPCYLHSLDTTELTLNSLAEWSEEPANSWNPSGLTVNAIAGGMLLEAVIASMDPRVTEVDWCASQVTVDVRSAKMSSSPMPMSDCNHVGNVHLEEGLL